MSSTQCDGELVTVEIPRKKKEPKKVHVCIPSKLEFPCDVLVRHSGVLARLPKNRLIVLTGCSKGGISGSLAKIYEHLKSKLCKSIEIEGAKIRVQAWSLEALVKGTHSYRIAEFIVYALAEEGILGVEYQAPAKKKKPKKPSKGAALSNLWYLITTGNERLRKKRGQAWRPRIKVWPRKIDKLCKNRN